MGLRIIYSGRFRTGRLRMLVLVLVFAHLRETRCRTNGEPLEASRKVLAQCCVVWIGVLGGDPSDPSF